MLKERHDPNPCVVRFTPGEYNHSFGGSPRHVGATPTGCTAPMHLVLTLDLRDPLVPLEADGTDLGFLPLYYPLRYGGGGGEAQYSVNSESQITVFGDMHELGEDNGADYPFPTQFPERPVSLKPLSYVQLRAIAASECGTNHHFDDPEKNRDFEVLKEINIWQMIRLGGGFRPIQGAINWACRNPGCGWFGKHVRVDVFASIVGSPTDEISIWGEYGECVEIYFCLMSCCNTITTVNRCT